MENYNPLDYGDPMEASAEIPPKETFPTKEKFNYPLEQQQQVYEPSLYGTPATDVEVPVVEERASLPNSGLPPKSRINSPQVSLPSGQQSAFPRAQSPDVRSGAEAQKKIADEVLGAGKTALTVGSSVAGEIVGGWRAIKKMILTGGDMDKANDILKKTRESFTLNFDDPTMERNINAIGDNKALNYLSDFSTKVEKGLGDATFKHTKSPALAALATTFPTILGEITGAVAGKTAMKAVNHIKNSRRKGNIASTMAGVVPSSGDLRAASKAIFKELDDEGVLINPSEYNRIPEAILKAVEKVGYDPINDPKIKRLLAVMEDDVGKQISISTLDKRREMAMSVAKSNDPSVSVLGKVAVAEIDDFLSTAGKDILEGWEKDVTVGRRYKAARELWGRAAKTDALTEIFRKARYAPSGMEQGVVSGIKTLLKNPKHRRYFTPKELKALDELAIGKPGRNLAQLIGNFDIMGKSPGIITTMNLLNAINMKGMIISGVGHVSQSMANRMIRKGAAFADDVIRAGADGEHIVEAYLKHTPKKLRNPEELSQLLVTKDIDFSKVKQSALTRKAMQLAQERRAFWDSAAATAAVQTQGENNE